MPAGGSDLLAAVVARAASQRATPSGVTGRLAALAHGVSDLALSGHLSRAGTGHADPDDLVDDLLGRLAP